MTKKPKRTSKKTAKSTKSVNEHPRIVWLYGAHPGITRQAMIRFLDYGADKNMQIRNALDLSLEDFIVPVHPYPAGKRNQVLKDLAELDTDVTFVAAGIEADQRNEKIQDLYEGTEVVWIHPGERDFHVAMQRETTDITYPEAQERMTEWTEFFGKHFEEKHIHIIR